MTFMDHLITRSRILSIFALILLSSVKGLLAQNPAQLRNTFIPGIDVSVGVLGQLTDTRSPIDTEALTGADSVTQRTQSASPSAGVLATFHQSFRPLLGYNVNVGYTRFTQTDSQSSGWTSPSNPYGASGAATYSEGALDTNMYELTIAAAFEGPRNKRFRTFGQFGGGGLFFVPINAPFASEQTRPAMVFGVGMDYKLSSHLSLRTEYRGLFYKGPDFAIDNGFPKQRLFTVTNTPAISLVYRFRGDKH